jgi:hypothetical protein
MYNLEIMDGSGSVADRKLPRWCVASIHVMEEAV